MWRFPWTSLRLSTKVALAVLTLACAGYSALSWSWSAPAVLSSAISPAVQAATPVVAVSLTKAQAAAWIAGGSYRLLQVAAQDAGGAWSKPQTLTPLTGFNAADPVIAVSPTGTAVAMWDVRLSSAPAGPVVQASTRPPGGSWASVTSLTSAATSAASQPRVGVDYFGNAVAIWLQRTSGGVAVETATLPAGGSWSVPVALCAPGTTAAAPTLAVNAVGSAIAGWQTADGKIVVAERRLGVWRSPITIAPAAFRQGSPRVALNLLGNEAIVWNRGATTFVSTRSAGGSWSAPTAVSTESTGATARVALDDLGNAVVIFASAQSVASGSVYPVQAVSRPVGGSWSAPVTISGASQHPGSLSLAATPLGTFVAGWVDSATGVTYCAIRPLGVTTFAAPTSVGAGTQPSFAVAAGASAAAWVGPGAQIQVSGLLTP